MGTFFRSHVCGVCCGFYLDVWHPVFWFVVNYGRNFPCSVWGWCFLTVHSWDRPLRFSAVHPVNSGERCAVSRSLRGLWSQTRPPSPPVIISEVTLNSHYRGPEHCRLSGERTPVRRGPQYILLFCTFWGGGAADLRIFCAAGSAWLMCVTLRQTARFKSLRTRRSCERRNRQGCFGFPLSSSKWRGGCQVPRRYCRRLMQPSLLKFVQIKPIAVAATQLYSWQVRQHIAALCSKWLRLNTYMYSDSRPDNLLFISWKLYTYIDDICIYIYMCEYIYIYTYMYIRCLRWPVMSIESSVTRSVSSYIFILAWWWPPMWSKHVANF
jgi:hypothetical protein